MSRRCCSQCGVEGHNRRNYDCPVNVDMRRGANARNEALRLGVLSYNKAQEELDVMTRLTAQWDARNISTSGFVRDMLVSITSVCTHMNTASNQEIHVNGIFDSLQRHVVILNTVIRRHTYARMIVVLIHDVLGGIFAEFEREELPDLEEPEEEKDLKKTSAYLKEEVYLVQDLTVNADGPSCECPLCYDSISAQDVVYTNCSHGFCGTCIKVFATSIKDNTKKPSCPMCRAEITELKMGKTEIYIEINEHICNL